MIEGAELNLVTLYRRILNSANQRLQDITHVDMSIHASGHSVRKFADQNLSARVE